MKTNIQRLYQTISSRLIIILVFLPLFFLFSFKQGECNDVLKLPIIRKELKVEGTKWFACGLSLVMHPSNPFVPTTHANWRYFELYDDDANITDCWFGGGADLTPYYLFEEDAAHFHQALKNAIDPFGKELYPKYKSKGFEILGVSLDDDHSDWKRAIAKDKVSWLQVNEPGGWEAKTAMLWNISAIPTSFLIDKEGNLIAMDLTGKELEKALKYLIDK